MSTSSQIKCPHCKKSFEMSAAVEENLRSTIEKEFEERSEKVRGEMEAAALDLKRKTEELTVQRTSIEKEVIRRLDANRKVLEAAARDAADAELRTLREEMQTQAAKLSEVQKNEIELRRQQRELEREKNEFQLKLTREMDSQRQKIVEETSTRIADEYSQKELEWTKQRADMVKQMDELRRKADQGSQQTQGEVVELEIEALLKEAFPHDSIDPVAKGVKGGDIVQVVQTRTGVRCGAIVWEIKQTRSWSDSWPTKLKDDQRAEKADLAVLVTAAMPKGVERFGQVDGVWVSDYKSFLGLALALRSSLIEVAQARQAQTGRKTKAEEVYSYIVGTEFRGRVQTLVETFMAMKEDLDAEKRAFDKIWQRREKQIMRVVGTTAGMYGEVSGLIGPSLPEIKELTLESIK